MADFQKFTTSISLSSGTRCLTSHVADCTYILYVYRQKLLVNLDICKALRLSPLVASAPVRQRPYNLSSSKVSATKPVNNDSFGHMNDASLSKGDIGLTISTHFALSTVTITKARRCSQPVRQSFSSDLAGRYAGGT